MDQDIFLANNTIVGEGPVQEASTTQPPPEEPAQGGASSLFGSGNMQLLLTMVAVFAIMYFMTIRPQRKKEMQLKEIQNSIKAGDWVITFSGMYGKAVDIGTDIIIVEFGTNKGIRIPIKKSELTKSQEPILTAKKDEAESDAK